jgi:4-hydroxybenzoate polyprenyltransferase
MGVAQKIASVPDLIRLESTLFALPFVYIGMLLAGNVTPYIFALITVALICARGAALSINRYVGLKYDMKNPKKMAWSSVSLYSRAEMLAIVTFFIGVFMASAYLLNMLAFVLAPFIVLIIVLEPHTKKYTAHRHFIMGLVIGLGIFGGYIGVKGAFPTTLPLYLLLLGYMAFSGANDVIYTLNHVDFDKANGLKTYPVKYGIRRSLRYSYYGHNMAALLFILFGFMGGEAAVVVGAFIAYLILMLEHRSINHQNPRSLQVAFFNYNIVVSAVMLLSVIVALTVA